MRHLGEGESVRTITEEHSVEGRVGGWPPGNTGEDRGG